MKLREQLERKIKAEGKSVKTYETYWHYCEDYLLWLKNHRGCWTHPKDAGRSEVEQWLSWMANDRHCAKSSQNTALQSVLYLYRMSVIHESVKMQIESVKVVWRHDQQDNPNGVSLPDSYRKKAPNAARELRWYWLFPGEQLSKGHEGVLCRHHRHTDHIARQIKEAADRAGIITRVTSHVLRHSYATHAHEQGVPVRTLMQLLGHESIETTEIYLHADKHGATAAHSPLTQLLKSERMHAPERERVTGPVTLKVYRGEVG